MDKVTGLALLFAVGLTGGCVEPDLYVTGTGSSTESPDEGQPQSAEQTEQTSPSQPTGLTCPPGTQGSC